MPCRLVGVIDAGTNKIRFVIYKLPNLDELLSHELRIEQISKKEGWLGKKTTPMLVTVQSVKIS